MKKTLIGVILLALFAIAGGGGYYYWTNTPEYALKQAYEGFQEKNRAKFENYLDVESVIGSAIDDVLANSMKDTMEKADGFGTIGAMLGSKLVETMKPQLINVTKKAIDRAFNPPPDDPERYAEEVAKKSNVESDLEKYFDNDMEISFVESEGAETSGNVSFVKLKFHHGIYNKDFLVKLKMDKSTSWKVSKIENFASLAEEMDKWKQDYLADFNAPTVQMFENKVTIQSSKRKLFEREFRAPTVFFTFKIKTNFDRPIKLVLGFLSLSGPDGKEILKETVFYLPDEKKGETELAPGETFEHLVFHDGSMFSSVTRLLTTTNPKDLKWKLIIESVRFADGETLLVYKSLPSKTAREGRKNRSVASLEKSDNE